MPLIVQDDTGTVEGANGYLSVADFKTYHDARGNTYRDDDELIGNAIVNGSDYVDTRFQYRGRKLRNREQRSQFPRANLYDRDRFAVNGIPQEVKDATAEYALRALSGTLNPDPENSTTGSTVTMTKEVLGPIEETVQYQQGGSSSQLPRYPAADLILRRAGFVLDGGEVRRG